MQEQSFGDMRTVDENATGGSDLVPAGIYLCYVAEYKFKPTRPGTPQEGLQVVLTLQIADGEHANKRIVDGFNVRNQNAQTVQISLQRLKGLTSATDQNPEQDLTETVMRNWLSKQAYVEFTVQPGQGQYGPKNSIKKFIHVNHISNYTTGAAAAPPQAGAAPQAPTQAPPVASQQFDNDVPWSGAQAAAAPQAPQAPSAPQAT